MPDVSSQSTPPFEPLPNSGDWSQPLPSQPSFGAPPVEPTKAPVVPAVRPTSRWMVWVAVGVSAALAVALLAEYRSSREAALATTKENLLATQFEPRRAQLEQFFTLSYQSVRTIGLLPSVRGIKGGNRKSDAVDIVKTGRFSVEGDRTVQQLFNNLAANVSVSEVYAIVDGFQPQQGEVPFFMYDHIVLGPESKSTEGDAAKTSDTPEEEEGEEYSYYPTQLNELRAKLPRLEVKTLDEIPAVMSPVMRTCDNTQYGSKASGDVRDAAGLLYSAPFYGPDGGFRGIVSAIFRVNVLEALLVGVPFVVVTDADRELARARQFAMPARFSDFVLANPARGIWLGDRREPALLERAKAFVAQGNDDGLHSTKLKLVDSSSWVLVYRLDPLAMDAAASRERTRFIVELVALFVLMLSIILGPIGIAMKRARVLEVDARISEIAAGGGDLTRRLDIQRKDEVGQLGRSFDGLLERIHDLIVNIKTAANGVAVGARELNRGNESVSDMLQQQAANTEQLAASVASLSKSVKENSDQAREVSTFALETSMVAETSGALVSSSRKAMAGVVESGKRIASIVELVQEIAFQTNLLALNASVEAARAGEHGRGFAVVAAEVRSLAERTASAVKEIRGLVDESSGRSGEMQEVIEKSGANLAQVAKAIRDLSGRITGIATSSEAQAREIASLNESIGGIDRSVQTNSATAEESSSVAVSLRQQADHLTTLVKQFKVRE
jgi:methyl-accepting chemotaxis protein